ncbi:hypothetical protein D3C78_1121320 [compost metagenome]
MVAERNRAIGVSVPLGVFVVRAERVGRIEYARPGAPARAREVHAVELVKLEDGAECPLCDARLARRESFRSGVQLRLEPAADHAEA